MKPMTSFEELRHSYEAKKLLINERMREFEEVYSQGDEAIFLELCFCIFTAGASARMGLTCIDAIKDVILTATADELEAGLPGIRQAPSDSGRIEMITIRPEEGARDDGHLRHAIIIHLLERVCYARRGRHAGACKHGR